MAKIFFCLFERVAIHLAKATEPEHFRELLGMLPAYLCHTVITSENIRRITATVNRFRREKENELAIIMGLGPDWRDNLEKKKKISSFLNDSFSGPFSGAKDSLKRQIKFLANLSRVIRQLRFGSR